MNLQKNVITINSLLFTHITGWETGDKVKFNRINMCGLLHDALSLLLEDVYKVEELGMSHTLCLPANLLNLSNLAVDEAGLL